MLFALSAVLRLQVWGLSVLNARVYKRTFTIGFGVLTPNGSIWSGDASSAILFSLLANTPQLILSIIYLTYNGLITSMFLAADFANYAFKGQYVMAASPLGKQRGTWFWGLPWLFGLGNLGLQTLLHWSLSQSIFVVYLDIYSADGSLDPRYSWMFSILGYSTTAIWISFTAGIVLVISAFGFGLLRFRDGSPPVVSTCSAAISAACHPGNLRDEATIYERVRWAAVGQSRNGIRHCSIVPARAWDAGKAGPVVKGAYYAGVPDDDTSVTLRTPSVDI